MCNLLSVTANASATGQELQLPDCRRLLSSLFRVAGSHVHACFLFVSLFACLTVYLFCLVALTFET